MSYYDIKELALKVITWLLGSDLFVWVILIIIISIFIHYRTKRGRYNICSFVIMGNTVNITRKNKKIAYKIYIQLKTRKLTLPIEENDVIIEVYDSWYKAFSDIRDLLSLVDPIHDNIQLINVTLNVLNGPMRNHLTKWQSKFRLWFDREIKSQKDGFNALQEIQKDYPQYDQLFDDLLMSQKQIIELSNELEKIFKVEGFWKRIYKKVKQK